MESYASATEDAYQRVGIEDEEPTHTADPVMELARERFQIPFLFPFQRLVITNILRYVADSAVSTQSEYPADQLVILPTGAGKSLCFTLPALLLPGITLIIFPLLALMNDQARRLDEVGITSVTLRGGQSKEDRQNIWDTLCSGSVRCLLSNPETLQSPKVLAQLQKVPIQHMVIDEAHIISQWGDSFRPAYLSLAEVVKSLEPPQITAFTATASAGIIQRIEEVLFGGTLGRKCGGIRKNRCHRIQANPDRTNITYHMIPSLHPSHDVMELIGTTLSALHNPTLGHGQIQSPLIQPLSPVERPLIIFCRSRRSVEVMAQQIQRNFSNLEVYFYHAGLEREEKERIEELFFRSTEGVLCATTAYGMGVDKKNIRTVIHYEPPGDVESYLQESGRGGRDRGPTTAIMLYPFSLQGNGRGCNRGRKPGGGILQNNQVHSPNLLLKIAQSKSCRRALLLEPLGGTVEMCGGCDICKGTAQQEPLYLQTLLQTMEKYKKSNSITIAAVLIGAWTHQVRMEHLYRVKEFGILSYWTLEEVYELIRKLEKQQSVLRKPPLQKRMVRRIATVIHERSNKKAASS